MGNPKTSQAQNSRVCVITYIFRERNRIPKEYAKVKSSHFDLFNFSNVYSFLIRRSLKKDYVITYYSLHGLESL